MTGQSTILSRVVRMVPSHFAALMAAWGASLPISQPLDGGFWLDDGSPKYAQPTPPTITTQPQSATILVGDTVTLTIAASDSESQVWEVDSGEGFEAIPLANGTSYTTPLLTTDNDGDRYRCVVTGPGGTVTSNVATLTVNEFEFTETTVFFHPMESYSSPTIGTATSTFLRSFESSQLEPDDRYTEAGHQTPAFQHSLSQGRRVYKSTDKVTLTLPFGDNRDLTKANWVAASATVAKDQTGMMLDAIAASSITALANDATVIHSGINAAPQVRTLSAFIKRLVGGGAIQMTLDGGVTWTDLTIADDGAYHRVWITDTVTNPKWGFRLRNSGDAIAIDAVNDVARSYRISPFFTRTDQSESKWTLSPMTAIEPNRRYIASISTEMLGLNGLAIGDGANRVRALPSDFGASPWNLASFRGGDPENNATGVGDGLTALDIQPGQEVKISLIWGRGSMKLLLDGDLQSWIDKAGKQDPEQMTYTQILGNGNYWDLEIKEIRPRTLCFAGDSITAEAYFKQLVHTQFDPVRYDVFNRGVGGNTILDLHARLATDVASTINTQTDSNIVVLWIGTNTLAANVSGATALSQLAALIADIKAAGDWDVYAIKTLPRGGGFENGATEASFSIEAGIYNDGLLAAGADKVIDFHVVEESRNPHDPNYYKSFKIHPTNALYDKLQPVLLDALEY